MGEGRVGGLRALKEEYYNFLRWGGRERGYAGGATEALDFFCLGYYWLDRASAAIWHPSRGFGPGQRELWGSQAPSQHWK